MLCAMLVLHILACTTISLSQAYDASIDVSEDSVTVEVRSSAAVSAEGARLMLRREQTVHWRSSLTRVDFYYSVQLYLAKPEIILTIEFHNGNRQKRSHR